MALGHDLARRGWRLVYGGGSVGLMGIEALRALMGHDNIQTALRYQKVTSSRAETVAQKALDTLLNPSV